ncbi:MAG: Asp23/Gls24 family envelope stress response protein [Oscillospiraceae bacterium]|nr:Asp23/Gls24 family envelope stress response protein [Oscillospiraceae bacterium]
MKNFLFGNKNSVGSIKISKSVVETITKNATLEIPGVDSVSFGNIGFRGLITKSSYSKPIKIEINEGLAHIQVSIIVDPNKRIPDLAGAVQTQVKNSVQSMTGLVVSGVDVIITGVTQNSLSE